MMKAVYLTKAIENTKQNIEALIEEKEAIIEVDVSESHVVNAVPAYLESILLNMFTNALKYSSPDRQLVLKLKSSIIDNKVMLEFSDNGLGIDLKRHGDKIFGMFKTFHRHKDAKGIGLFISKNQIEAMGGSISVRSKVDVGTTFTMVFEKRKAIKKKEK